MKNKSIMSKKFSLISLGCFRNTCDSEVVLERFNKLGYEYSPFNPEKKYSLLVINTCGFIDKAKEEAIEVITQAVEFKRQGLVEKLFVFGCFVERYLSILKKNFPEVDQWWGVERFNSSSFPRSSRLTPPWIYFLKIAEGCAHRCSFCSIPLIKKGLRSKSKEDILREVRFAQKQGVKELNIIGQDITSWGKDLGGKYNLTSLLKSILKEAKTISWIRLIYLHPALIDDSLIKLVQQEERICKYIDIPIQHINNRLLKLMCRETSKEDIIYLIKKLRENIPHVFLRTSVICGFPTEREEEFLELLNFLRETKFERLGAFTYSREEGTPAFHFKPQIHYRTKLSRWNKIMQQQRDISAGINKNLLGKKLEVLIEDKDQGVFMGRSRYDTYNVDGTVYVKRKNCKIGEIVRVEIIDNYEYDLVGA